MKRCWLNWTRYGITPKGVIKIFIDSSVIIAGLISAEGGSAKVLSLCESGIIEGWISRQVVDEVEKTMKNKAPYLCVHFEKLKIKAKLKILEKVKNKNLLSAKSWIMYKNDVPILAAAKDLNVDVLLTLDLRHFIKDPMVSKKSGLIIMTPGNFLKGFLKVW